MDGATAYSQMALDLDLASRVEDGLQTIAEFALHRREICTDLPKQAGRIQPSLARYAATHSRTACTPYQQERGRAGARGTRGETAPRVHAVLARGRGDAGRSRGDRGVRAHGTGRSGARKASIAPAQSTDPSTCARTPNRDLPAANGGARVSQGPDTCPPRCCAAWPTRSPGI